LPIDPNKADQHSQRAVSYVAYFRSLEILDNFALCVSKASLESAKMLLPSKWCESERFAVKGENGLSVRYADESMPRSSVIVLLVKALNLTLFNSSSTRKTIFPVNPSANIEPATVCAGYMIPFRSPFCCFEASTPDAGGGGIYCQQRRSQVNIAESVLG
jgi:hypothetical protein